MSAYNGVYTSSVYFRHYYYLYNWNGLNYRTLKAIDFVILI